jgi:hypothetical protein
MNHYVALAAAVAVLGSHTSAATIVSSGLSGTSSNVTALTGSASPGKGKAITWSMGSTAHLLDSVQIRLSTSETLPSTDNITFALYSDTLNSSSQHKPGSLLATFTDPTLVANTTTNYTLTLPSAFTLAANTKYWFVATGTTTTGTLGWTYQSPTSITTSGGATVPPSSSNPNPRAIIPNNQSVSNPTLWSSTSTVYNDFVLNATEVPEPTTLTVAAVGVAGVLLRRRRA